MPRVIIIIIVIISDLTCLLALVTLTLPSSLASDLTLSQSETEQPSSAVMSASEVVTPVTSWPRHETRKLPLRRTG